MSRSTFWTHPDARACAIFIGGLAVVVTAFLFAVGLNSHSLPFPREAAYSDAVISHWPNALFLRQTVRDEGTWPLWRPLIMSGQPFAANPLNKVWYPPQWLVLLVPPTLHLNMLIALHLVLAGAGAYVWGRSTGLEVLPGALTGAGYAFAPRVIAAVGAGHLDLVYAAAWVPWLLWAVGRIIQPQPGRYASVTLGVTAALCFLADVRLSAYAFVLAAGYGLWRWWITPVLRTRHGLRIVGPRLVSGVMLAAGLSAFQWVPLLLYAPDLSRTAITLEEAAFESLTPAQWIGLLLGDHGGGWESLVYVGVSTLLLAIVALVLNPRRLWFWGAVVIFAGLWAMGDHFVVWSLLARLIPPLRWWRVPPRAWLIAALALPYLAGWGAQLLAAGPSVSGKARLATVGLLGGGLVCGVASSLTLAPPLELTATLGVLALPLTAAVMMLAYGRHVSAQVVALLFALIVLGDVLWIDRTLVTGRDEREWLDPYRELAAFLVEDGAVRVYSPSYSLPQQVAAEWGIAQADGVDPFQLASYVEAISVAMDVPPVGYSVTLPPFAVDDASDHDASDHDAADATETDFRLANRDARPDADLLGEWLVTHVVSAYPLDIPGLEWAATYTITLADGTEDAYVYRNTRAPDIWLDWDGPNRLNIHAAGPRPGRLYAVAAGRWTDDTDDADDVHDTDDLDDAPGLPGTVPPVRDPWTLVYGWSEIYLSLVAAIGLADMAGIIALRWCRDS